jgi:hypothetical protein
MTVVFKLTFGADHLAAVETCRHLISQCRKESAIPGINTLILISNHAGLGCNSIRESVQSHEERFVLQAV